VAAVAGVSVTVASRAINNKDEISPETRARVLQAAQALRYVPNSVARALILSKTKTVGVVVTDNTIPIYAQLVKGIEQTLTLHGYSLLLCSSSDCQTRAIQCIANLVSKNVDGIILAPTQTDTSDIEIIQHFQLPFVLVFRNFASIDTPFVILDNVKAGYLATRHLVEHGHRRIGHVAGPAHVSSAQGRVEGYRLALHEARLSFEPRLVAEGPYTLAGGYQAALRLLGAAERPSAIFAATDMQALGVVKAAKELGLRIPEDLALVGGDDLEIAEFTAPPLTTFYEPAEEMGSKAAEILLAMLGEPYRRDIRQLIFEPRLVIRTSCGCKA
jgi:LacI family transcriptional regulator